MSSVDYNVGRPTIWYLFNPLTPTVAIRIQM